MKRGIICILMLMALVAVAAPYKISQAAAQAPVIDGVLDDACWQNALKFDKFNKLNLGTPASLKTEAFLTYDSSALYVAFKCYRPAGGQAKLVPEKDAYSNDHVEIMVDPNFTQNRYFHYLIGINGKIYNASRTEGGYVGDSKWKSSMKAAVSNLEGMYIIEAKLPFSTMSITPNNTTWGFNFARGDWAPPFAEESSITKSGLFHVAGEFVPVEGINVNLAEYSWEITVPTMQVLPDEGRYKANVVVPVTNMADKAQEIVLDFIVNGGDKGITGASLKEKFAPKEQRNIEFRDIALKEQGTYQLIADVLVPESRRILKRSYFRQDVEFSPLDIKLIAPCYRNAIFVSQELKNVEYELLCKATDISTIRTGIKDANGKVLVEKNVARNAKVSFPVASLPEGKMTIFAEAGKHNATAPLRKLPFRKGEAWRDKDGIWHIEKEKYFPVFNWGTADIDGANGRVSSLSNIPYKRVDGALMWSSSPTHKFLRMPRITPEMEKVIRAQVRKIADNGDNQFAYYLCDEPEISGVSASALKHFADIIRDEDPYHPLLVSNDTVAGTQDFYYVAELNGLHPYPNPAHGKPRNDFSKVAIFCSQATAMNKAHGYHQTIAFLQQGFNYGDCGAANSRIPSYDEIRTQYLLAFTLGTNAVEFYNFCNCHYPELGIGITDFAQECTRVLAPAMTSPDFPGASSDNVNAAIRVKKVGNEYWILAAGLSTDLQKANFTVPGLGNRKLHVLREGRTLTAKGNVFSDSFKNFDARVYTTDARDFGLPLLKEVEERIEKVYASRKKPGNLAHQRFEGETVKVTSNSNKHGGRRPDTMLWHVADGVYEGFAAYGPQNNEGYLIYSSRVDPKMPIWLQMEFKEPKTMGRIAVYTANKSIAAFDLQVRVNGEWVTVAEENEFKGDAGEYKFAPRKADAVRINMKKLTPKSRYALIHEIEVYEK